MIRLIYNNVNLETFNILVGIQFTIPTILTDFFSFKYSVLSGVGVRLQNKLNNMGFSRSCMCMLKLSDE